MSESGPPAGDGGAAPPAAAAAKAAGEEAEVIELEADAPEPPADPAAANAELRAAVEGIPP
ncbi:MAG TPA: hypothetical protein VHE35_06555, partial [Kofleriaceae bacterium]|nr:hypothetical protein [Kofleriaceae bacterium]